MALAWLPGSCANNNKRGFGLWKPNTHNVLK
jgi:hypothetical protein